jgi:ABC-type glycerol-3-phosphate transport system substrate-binding protein
MDDEMMVSPDVLGLIEYAPAPRADADGAYSGPAATDFYAIPANTPVNKDLLFQIIMETADAQSQSLAVEQGIVSRTSVAQSGAGGRNLEAASTTIAEGAGSYGTNPAVGIAQTAIANNLPAAADIDPSAEDAEAQIKEILDEAAEEYIREATAQGFISESE